MDRHTPESVGGPDWNRQVGISVIPRYELKYQIPGRFLAAIRERIFPFVSEDPYGKDRRGGIYIVRNIYFDTTNLRFYRDSILGVNARKKIRLRTYNEAPVREPAFLEIKRRRGKRAYKERLQLELADVEAALESDGARDFLIGREISEGRKLDRFRYLFGSLELEPTLLVRYEREAWEGSGNPRDRITFDRNIGCISNPEFDQIFLDKGLKELENDMVIMELKFDDEMPRWMKRFTRELRFRPTSFSKYCRGVEACREGGSVSMC